MNRKYTNVGYSESSKKQKWPASAVAVATLDGVGNFVGSGTMIAEVVATTTSLFSSFGYRTDLGNHVAEGVIPPPLFNQHKVDLGNFTAECVAVANFGIYGSGGAIDILEEGVLVKAAATSLNFIGVDVLASVGTLFPTGADIFIPAPLFPSHFGTIDGSTTATVSNIATTNRYVAAPTVEGTPYYASTWADGALHPVSRTSPWIWTPGGGPANLILFENLTSTFTVTITDPSGVIATHTTAAITGNTVSIGSNITVTITNWGSVGAKYQGNVSISVDIAAIIPNSGVANILLRHANVVNYDVLF